MALSISQIEAVTNQFDKADIKQQVYEKNVILDRLNKSHRIIELNCSSQSDIKNWVMQL